MPDGSIIIAVPPCEITSTRYTFASGATVTNSAGLTSREPADFATLNSLDPSKCYVSAELASVNKINGTAHGAVVKLPNLSVSARQMERFAYYRTYMADATSFVYGVNTAVPTGVTTTGSVSATGGASATTLDDDPYTGGSTAYYNVSPASTLLIDFGTPSSGNTTGTGTFHLFAVQLKPQTTNTSDRVSLKLYDNGVLVSTLREVYLPEGIGMVTLVAAWDASTVSSLANAQLMIDTADAVNNVQVHRARWYACSANSRYVYDTGFVELGYRDSLSAAAGSLQSPQLAHLTATGLVAGAHEVVHAWACDALTNMSTAYDATVDVLRVGRLWGSGHIQPANGPGPGSSVTVEDASTSGETVGGQTTGNVGARRRVANLSMPMLTGPEAATLAWRLDYGSGKLNPFMVSILPDDDDFRAWGCLYCTMEPDGITFPSATIRTRTMNLREKL